MHVQSCCLLIKQNAFPLYRRSCRRGCLGSLMTIMKCWKASALPLSHTTPASCLCVQSWLPQPLCKHWPMLVSFPIHAKSSSQIRPVPSPKYDFRWAFIALAYPSCLHTTLASLSPHSSSQIVPQDPTRYTSTRPSKEPFTPSTKRTS